MSIGHLLSVTAFALVSMAGMAQAQGPPAPDFSKVEIKTTKIGPNFFTLEGQGGTIGVLSTPDGVFMVDSQFAPLTDKIVAAIGQISTRPIKFLVNTHVHGDHVGGNENLGKLGVVILARDQLRARLAAGPRPAAAPALPVITYDDGITITMSNEPIQLIPIRSAHTDGDTLIRFPQEDVIMTGDFYRAVGYPFFDRANGGSFNGLIHALETVVNLAGASTKIVPGHGPIVDAQSVAAHRTIALAVRDNVAALVRQGKTADEIVAAKPTADFDAKVTQGAQTAERFVRALVAELGPNPQ